MPLNSQRRIGKWSCGGVVGGKLEIMMLSVSFRCYKIYLFSAWTRMPWRFQGGDACVSMDLSKAGKANGTLVVCSQNWFAKDDGCDSFVVECVTMELHWLWMIRSYASPPFMSLCIASGKLPSWMIRIATGIRWKPKRKEHALTLTKKQVMVTLRCRSVQILHQVKTIWQVNVDWFREREKASWSHSFYYRVSFAEGSCGAFHVVVMGNLIAMLILTLWTGITSRTI